MYKMLCVMLLVGIMPVQARLSFKAVLSGVGAYLFYSLAQEKNPSKMNELKHTGKKVVYSLVDTPPRKWWDQVLVKQAHELGPDIPHHKQFYSYAGMSVTCGVLCIVTLLG